MHRAFTYRWTCLSLGNSLTQLWFLDDKFMQITLTLSRQKDYKTGFSEARVPIFIQDLYS